MIRRGALIIALAILTPNATALADSASKHAKVKELFQLTYMQSRMEQTKASAMAQAQSYAKQQLASFALPKSASDETERYYQQVYALVTTKYDWDKLEPLYEEVYAGLYTEEELDGILAFYKSPVGRALLAKTPEVTTRILAISKEQYESVAPQIKQLTEDFVARIRSQEQRPTN